MKSILIAALVLFLAGCPSSGGTKHSDYRPVDTGSSHGWAIGPIVKSKNYSENLPAYPVTQGEGWYVDFASNSQLDAVVWRGAPNLTGATKIVMRYQVTGTFTPADGAGSARVGLMFQRKGDNWSGKGKYQTYRWYTTGRPVIQVGEGLLEIPFDASLWNDVQGKNNYPEFVSAMSDVDNIEVVFGSDLAASHGVYGAPPARFTMISLQIEH